MARGDHREPQLLDDAARAAADGAARRGRDRAGRRRHLPGRRAGPATRRSSSSRSRSRPTPRAGPKVATVYPHPIAFNALPHIDVFLDNGYTKEEWKVVTESRKILHLPDLRVSCTAVRVPVFISHSEAVHVETRDPITPAEARDAVRAASRASSSRTTRRRTSIRWRPRPPGSDEVYVGRVRQDLSIDGNRGLAFWVVSRQPAQGRGVERRGDRRGARRARLDPQGERAPAGAGPGDAPRDARRAPGGARGDRRARSGRARDAASTRRARRPCPARATPTPRSCSSARARASTRTARAGRSSVAPAGCSSGSSAAIGWRREDVFITNVVKCRPPDNRDPQPDEIAACAPYLRRQLEVLDPAVVVTLGRYSMGTFMPGARIGQVARDDAAGRPGDRRRERPRVRDVPPRRGAALAGRRARRASRTCAASRRCSPRARAARGRAPRARAPGVPTMAPTAATGTRGPADAATPTRRRHRHRRRAEPAADDASQLTLF